MPAKSEEGADWFNVPENRSAVALFIPGESIKGHEVSLSSDGGVLDRKVWELDRPFLRQYRFKPGAYKVFLPQPPDSPIKSVDIEAKNQSLTFVQVNPEDGSLFLVQFGYSPKFDSFLKETVSIFYKDGLEKYITPAELSPEANIIRVNTDLPWSIKPPKK